MEKGQEGTPYRMEKTMLKVGFTTDKEKDSIWRMGPTTNNAKAHKKGDIKTLRYMYFKFQWLILLSVSKLN